MEDFHANRVGILAILARVLLRGLVFFFLFGFLISFCLVHRGGCCVCIFFF